MQNPRSCLHVIVQGWVIHLFSKRETHVGQLLRATLKCSPQLSRNVVTILLRWPHWGHNTCTTKYKHQIFLLNIDWEGMPETVGYRCTEVCHGKNKVHDSGQVLCGKKCIQTLSVQVSMQDCEVRLVWNEWIGKLLVVLFPNLKQPRWWAFLTVAKARNNKNTHKYNQ